MPQQRSTVFFFLLLCKTQLLLIKSANETGETFEDFFTLPGRGGNQPTQDPSPPPLCLSALQSVSHVALLVVVQ